MHKWLSPAICAQLFSLIGLIFHCGKWRPINHQCNENIASLRFIHTLLVRVLDYIDLGPMQRQSIVTDIRHSESGACPPPVGACTKYLNPPEMHRNAQTTCDSTRRALWARVRCTVSSVRNWNMRRPNDKSHPFGAVVRACRSTPRTSARTWIMNIDAIFT